ncbi:Purine ribonucleoside efflux pump NepI [Xanthomonas arboricola pv. corylina]|nr:Purine ribonucleoside efflux pump NepI [Xanthomonas arboricola pv. corylina]CAE6697623.1 Purine ribonucleoside efflux pump NepI [Xanthomonas arboricola pv. corylina]
MQASSLATDPSSRAAAVATRQTWSAVGSMSLCVALLIASEFMPVSLLTPIAADRRRSARQCRHGRPGDLDLRPVRGGRQPADRTAVVALQPAPCVVGWRGVFWGMLPLVALTIAWQWRSLPSMPAQGTTSLSGIVTLLKRRYVARAMLAVMLGFAGAFSAFTYFRPFLETVAQVDVSQLSLLLLGLGLAGFVGTYAATALVPKRLFTLLSVLPVALGVATISMLLAGHLVWAVAVAMIAWGTLNSAMPVAWSTWLSRCVKDAPESGGGLMVAAIQLSIMLGGAAGGVLLDHVSIGATFVGASVLLLASSLVAGRGDRLQPRGMVMKIQILAQGIHAVVDKRAYLG